MKVAVEHISKRYGDHTVLNDISFEISEGEVVVLMGTNGSGKTTLLNILTGFVKQDAGDVLVDGVSINKLKPFERSRRGIGRTFQDLRLINGLTVIDNLLLAFPAQKGEKWWNALFPSKKVKAEQVGNREKAGIILKQCFIDDVADAEAAAISYGQQKLLNLACCMAGGAPFLLLDEPVAGVNPAYREKLSDVLKALKSEGKGILIIEHNRDFIETVADEILFLFEGKLRRYGSYDEFRNDKDVIEAYL